MYLNHIPKNKTELLELIDELVESGLFLRVAGVNKVDAQTVISLHLKPNYVDSSWSKHG